MLQFFPLTFSLEIYFKDSRSLLIVFLDKTKRLQIDQRLSAIIHKHSPDAAVTTPGLLKTPVFGRMGVKIFSGLRADELSVAQRKWQAREISNVSHETSPLSFLTNFQTVHLHQYPEPNIRKNPE